MGGVRQELVDGRWVERPWDAPPLVTAPRLQFDGEKWVEREKAR